jgi:Trk K+ transport system NAD-binding subunit
MILYLKSFVKCGKLKYNKNRLIKPQEGGKNINMKQMTCAQMGGPATCTTVITGATADEMVKNGTTHVMSSHPDIAEQMKKMTPEQNAAWMADFQKKFDALPEM